MSKCHWFMHANIQHTIHNSHHRNAPRGHVQRVHFARTAISHRRRHRQHTNGHHMVLLRHGLWCVVGHVSASILAAQKDFPLDPPRRRAASPADSSCSGDLEYLGRRRGRADTIWTMAVAAVAAGRSSSLGVLVRMRVLDEGALAIDEEGLRALLK